MKSQCNNSQKHHRLCQYQDIARFQNIENNPMTNCNILQTKTQSFDLCWLKSIFIFFQENDLKCIIYLKTCAI